MNTSLPKKVLLTGVTGFIGQHLAAKLIGLGVTCHAIVRPDSDISGLSSEIHFHIHDSTTSSMVECCRAASPDAVIHLASCFLAQHVTDDIDRLVDTNLRFGLQLLEAMSVIGCRNFINTGTGWQHYENKDYDPVCLYAATKQAFEALITYYVNVESFKVITIKLHDTFGPGDTRRKIVSLLIDSAKSASKLELSPGEQLLDLTHIDDVTEAFILTVAELAAMKVPSHEERMITSGQPESLRQIALQIEKAMGRTIDAKWGARPYRDREVMVPWNRGVIPSSWSPQKSLEVWVKDQS